MGDAAGGAEVDFGMIHAIFNQRELEGVEHAVALYKGGILHVDDAVDVAEFGAKALVVENPAEAFNEAVNAG